MQKLSILLLTTLIVSGCLPRTPAITMSLTEPATPIVVIQSCPTSDICQEAQSSGELPFQGIWVSTSKDDPKLDSQIIVFTDKTMYRVQTDIGIGTDQTNEKFADIIAYDLENNHIVLRTQWIRVNGVFAGFDAPNFTITYLIEKDTLRIGIGWDGEFAKEVGTMVFYRK